jgi:hypothetical protein
MLYLRPAAVSTLHSATRAVVRKLFLVVHPAPLSAANSLLHSATACADDVGTLTRSAKK